MRIGLLGGTFDPPHRGHLTIARACREALELEEILFVPAHRNPLKASAAAASARDRYEMVRLAIADEPGAALTDLELRRGGASYMVDTLFELQAVRPGDYWIIAGTDVLPDFPRWKGPERLLRMARIAAVPRGRDPMHIQLDRLQPEVRAAVDLIPMAQVEISSTDLRNRLRRGQPVGDQIPTAVLSYIRERRLYQA